MTPLTDLDTIEAVLLGAARARVSLSYSDALLALGLPFSRPKLRALCKALDAIDERAAARGEPALSVLVVRESDGLPGQGWWIGRPPPWTGPGARFVVEASQAEAFEYWKQEASGCLGPGPGPGPTPLDCNRL